MEWLPKGHGGVFFPFRPVIKICLSLIKPNVLAQLAEIRKLHGTLGEVSGLVMQEVSLDLHADPHCFQFRKLFCHTQGSEEHIFAFIYCYYHGRHSYHLSSF